MTRLTIALTLSSCSSLAAFEETLASVLEYQPASCDVVVLHSVPYGDQWNTREDGVQFEEMPQGVTQVSMLNRALELSRGDVVLLLAPGTELRQDAIDTALAAFSKDPLLGWLIPAIVAPNDSRNIVSLGYFFRTTDGLLRPFRRSDVTENAAAGVQVSGIALVPHSEAVYIRRQAIASIESLDASFGDAPIALADAVMRMDLLGWIGCVSVGAAVSAVNTSIATSPFRRGHQLERLYRRWRPTSGSGMSHWFLTQQEFWSAMPFPSAVFTLLGRLSAMAIVEPSLEETRRLCLEKAFALAAEDSALATLIPIPPQKKWHGDGAAA
ncbi:MAG: hypothetical protein ACRC46_15125 [Thermoguttaceae bacterium]